MTTTEALTAAKNRLNIRNVTTFDTELTDFFDTAVDRLSPKIMQEVAPQTVTATEDVYGEQFVTLSSLPTPLEDVRLVEATNGAAWFPVDSIYRHGTSLRIRGLDSTATQLKIYGLNPYVVSGATVALPERLELPVIWYMMAEFYDMLVGSKSKFNVYIQNSAGNAMDDLRSESTYYSDKADQYIEEHANILYGAQ